LAGFFGVRQIAAALSPASLLAVISGSGQQDGPAEREKAQQAAAF
jgi:hypothetical protein